MSVDRLIKTVEGREALSDFRRRRLLAKLKVRTCTPAFDLVYRIPTLRAAPSASQAVNSAVDIVTAKYVHYVELKSALDESERRTLKQLLTYGPRPNQQEVCVVKPATVFTHVGLQSERLPM
jgi:hypothetical protein